MQPLEDYRPQSPPRPIALVFRGLAAGVLGVVAIAVWAANMEEVFQGRARGGAAGAILRVALCDAVPLATLFAIYRGIGRNDSFEAMLRGILTTTLTLGGLVRVSPSPGSRVEGDGSGPPAGDFT